MIRLAALLSLPAVIACAAQRPALRAHALAGKLWDVHGRRFVDRPALDAALRAADLVLLGETHDNPEHHLLEAQFLRAAAAGRRLPVVFEMLTADQQAPLDAARAGTPEEVARAVQWDKSGWPPFPLYRPVFAAALDLSLPIVAGNLTHAQVKEIFRQGKLPPDVAALLAREGPQPEEVARAVREDMKAEHCGQLPEAMAAPMALVQRARDATLALRMGGSAVLIAGSGHVRTDRGVPVHLAASAPGRSVVSVAFIEGAAGKETPGAYDLPFDFAVFTGAAQRDDPCKGISAKLRR